MREATDAMHECPNCGQVCDCIGDDTWDSLESLECRHECEPAYDEESLWEEFQFGDDDDD